MPKRVLVVDDDAAVRDVMAAVLEDEGYRVSHAADGLEALERFAREPVDVIVLDYAMPRCDGEEFARRFRERHEKAAPIILVTASHQLAERCRRVGADGCIGKPFDVDVLLQVVEDRTHTHAA